MSPNKFSTPEHLIIVCCHGIWLGDTPNEDNWLIRGFQAGETPTFIEHIKIGLRLLVADEPGENALMFSGAPTRKETHISEAESYLSLAKSQDFFNLVPHTPSKYHSFGPSTSPYTPYLIAEPRALDSFQNVLFPLLAFNEFFGSPPKKVTVVSHEFKRARFEELHFPALKKKMGWDLEWRFEGRDPEYMVQGGEEYDEGKAREVRELERRNGFEMWQRDPTGQGEETIEKRKKRDAWGVQFAKVDEPRVTEVE